MNLKKIWKDKRLFEKIVETFKEILKFYIELLTETLGAFIISIVMILILMIFEKFGYTTNCAVE